MSEREYVIRMLARGAQRWAEHRHITDVPALVTLLADDAAHGAQGGAGPAGPDSPRYAYQCHRRGVWLGDMAHMRRGTPDIIWREVAEVALGVERPQQMVLFA